VRQYELNDTVSLRHEVRNADDQLVSGGNVAVTITAPDGTTDSPAMTEGATGVFDGAYAADQYGPYRVRIVVTGAVNDVRIFQFYVADPETDLPPLGSFDRLANKLGYRPEGEERSRAERLLGEASELIRDVAGKTWTDDTTNALVGVPVRVANICVAAAFRAFNNPEALSQRSIGDSSKSYDRAGREGGEDVYLTTAEEKSVRRADTGSSMISVTLVTPYNVESLLDPWAEVTAE
jgi:hypothetical protein